MKTAIVPAQITTVEDRVAGNLSFSQLILLIAPLFLGGVIYALAPPFAGVTMAKTVAVMTLTLVCFSLALRIKGRLVLDWIVLISKYNSRPRRYVFNKNHSYLRARPEPVADEVKQEKPTQKPSTVAVKDIAVKDLVYLEELLADPRADFHLRKSKKGALNVNIKQIK